jgi:hypothetical protein
LALQQPALSTTPFAAQTNMNQKKKNPKYPDLPFDKYMANPYFHKINLCYPGLQLIHEEPFIFIINDLFSPDECERLIQKARGYRLRPQIGGGNVVRTSSGIVCTHDEVPTLRQKLQQLIAPNDERQLQYLKVSQYLEGQTFSKHTDAWPTEGAPITNGWIESEDFFGDQLRSTKGCYPAKNQPNHNTLLTTFCYLNTVPGSGYTCFPNIGLHRGTKGDNFYENPVPMSSLSPRPDTQAPWDWDYRTRGTEPLRVGPERGMAVLHFCSTLPEYGGLCDGNTFHIAEPPAPGMEKFVAQQFVASCTDWVLPDDSIPYGRVSWDTV